MKLSIVIPAYNEEKYIKQCLDSILEERNKHKDFDIEIIVVNNASTDNTREILATFPDIKIIDEPRKGLAIARQTGFLNSSGDLIANIDADCVLPEEWLNKVFLEFTTDNNLIALSGPFVYYDLTWFVNLEVKFYYFIGYIAYLVNHFVLNRAGMLQGGNFVLRREALKQIGGYNTKINFYGEDTDIAFRMQKIGLIKFTFDLPMYSSGRRLKKEGVLLSGARYAINYVWVVMFKKPFSKKYSEVNR